MPGEGRPIRVALFQEGVASFLGFPCPIRESRGFACKNLLADQAIVDSVERKLHHANRGGALRHDGLRPGDCLFLQVLVGDHLVHCPHLVGALCAVFFTEEEHLPGELLANLLGEIGTSKSAIEGGDIHVGLLEARVLATGNSEITHHVQAVSATSRPAGNGGDHDFGHETNKSLHLEDVESTRLCGVRSCLIVGVGVTVPIGSPDALIAPRAKGPSAVFRAWPISREDDDTESGLQSRVIERLIELIDGTGTKRVSHFWSIERDPRDGAFRALVVGDVRQVVKAGNASPRGIIKELGNHALSLRPPKHGKLRGMSTPSLEELRSSVHPLVLPMRIPFRGLQEREVLLFEGPKGLAEWSPFVEYDDDEASRWLQCALEQGWGEPVVPEPPDGARIRINGTLGAIPASEVESAITLLGHPRTIKVKVAGPFSTITEDIERVNEVRRVLGTEGRIRIDANGHWSLDEAEHAIRQMEHADLEYVEQPVTALHDMAELRRRLQSLGILIAADESIRRWSDLEAVIAAEACDVAVLKVQPLGGIASSLALITTAVSAGLEVVLSSALESSVGIYYAASLQHYLAKKGPVLDAGLGTVSFLTEDPVRDPLVASGDVLELRRPILDRDKLQDLSMPKERHEWWAERLERCFARL